MQFLSMRLKTFPSFTIAFFEESSVIFTEANNLRSFFNNTAFPDSVYDKNGKVQNIFIEHLWLEGYEELNRNVLFPFLLFPTAVIILIPNSPGLFLPDYVFF